MRSYTAAQGRWPGTNPPLQVTLNADKPKKKKERKPHFFFRSLQNGHFIPCVCGKDGRDGGKIESKRRRLVLTDVVLVLRQEWAAPSDSQHGLARESVLHYVSGQGTVPTKLGVPRDPVWFICLINDMPNLGGLSIDALLLELVEHRIASVHRIDDAESALGQLRQ